MGADGHDRRGPVLAADNLIYATIPSIVRRGSPGSSSQLLAPYCALGSGIGGFLYSVAFVLIARPSPKLGAGLSWVLLMIGGFLSAVVMVALYERLREVDRNLALLGLLLATVGALGSVIHGGYEVANLTHPPSSAPPDLPSQIDPRGLVTFGFAGLGLLGFASLMRRSPIFPAGLGTLGLVTGAAMIVVYLGRLIIFSPTNAVVLLAAGLTGFLLAPVWYIWLGLTLRRSLH
jgi:hypothetical protein